MKLGVVGTIARLRIKLLLRDRSAAFFMLLLPVMLIFIIGIAIGNQADRSPFGIAAPGPGPTARSLEDDLARSRALKVIHYRDRAALQHAMRRGEVLAGVVIPAGYDEALRTGRAATVEFLSDPTKSATGVIRAAVSRAVNHQSAIFGAARIAGSNPDLIGPAQLDRVLATARSLAAQAGGVTVERTTVTGKHANLPGGFQWTASTNLVLFIFITSLVAGGRVVSLRVQGLAQRVLAAPVGSATLLAGELLGSYLVAAVQGLVIVLIGAVVFGVHWGSFPGTLAVLAVSSLVATGLGILLGSFLRTEEQAAALGPPLGIGLGMLGGCMWPLAIVGKTMRLIGHVTPQAWAVDAYIKLVGNGAGIGAILPQLSVLAAFAVLIVPVAAWRFRRSVVAA